MKYHLKRTLVALLAGALLLGTASCGRPEGWSPFRKKPSASEQAIQTLETKFEELKAKVAGGKPESERTAFWRTAAMGLAVLGVVALVGGAALGSRARRERERFRSSAGSSEAHATPAPPRA